MAWSCWRRRDGYEEIKGETTSEKRTGKVVVALSIVIQLLVIACLLAAYFKDLGGEVNIYNSNQVDLNPCELEVDATSARRISHLIHKKEIKLFYLHLKFPEGAEVNKTENIFRAYSMVWTFGGQPGTKHFLDLPWMYLSWSFGLLDHYTCRNVELRLRILGNDTCSLFVGTPGTTRAIVNALKELTINITRENKQIDEDVMDSTWCQTYFKDDISPSFMGFAKLFRFYFSNFRYMCSQLYFSYDSCTYEVVTEDKHRPLTRQWSWLPFLFSIVSLWFFPLLFLYSESLSYDEENIYLGVNSPSTHVNILRFLFHNCSFCGTTSKSSNVCSYVMFLLFLVVVCPSGIYVTYLILLIHSEARTMLSELNERDDGNAWFIHTGTQFFTSDGFPLLFYIIWTLLLCVILCCINCTQTKNADDQGHAGKSAEFEGWRCWFNWLPWLYVSCKFVTCICQFRNQNQMIVLIGISVFFYSVWIFFFLQILFKSLMFFWMFFSFGILATVTFPKFISGIVIYILTGVLFCITRAYYLLNEYYKF